jgi:hypothetical protein
MKGAGASGTQQGWESREAPCEAGEATLGGDGGPGALLSTVFLSSFNSLSSQGAWA